MSMGGKEAFSFHQDVSMAASGLFKENYNYCLLCSANKKNVLTS